MSIITNFGCHGKCPYCIVRENGIDVPETTLEGLEKLIDEVKKNDCNIVSVSGGGDPLHNYKNHTDYYAELFKKLSKNDIPMEMHTSYVAAGRYFPAEDCKRVVYHLRDIKQLEDVTRCGNEIVRIVFVVTEKISAKDIVKIAGYVQNSKEIDELSFRQMVGSSYEIMSYNQELLKWGHENELWHYIEQNDYNLYYVNGQVYEKFSEIHK